MNGENNKKAVTWIAPVILTIIAGVGSVVFTSGAREQRLNSLEQKATALQKQIDDNDAKSYARYITREELRAYLDGQTRALEQIQDDVRALRYRK